MIGLQTQDAQETTPDVAQADEGKVDLFALLHVCLLV
jgi:hypothetical protein